jgi:hypothetical protein
MFLHSYFESRGSRGAAVSARLSLIPHLKLGYAVDSRGYQIWWQSIELFAFAVKSSTHNARWNWPRKSASRSPKSSNARYCMCGSQLHSQVLKLYLTDFLNPFFPVKTQKIAHYAAGKN